jgi:hypothetical protein
MKKQWLPGCSAPVHISSPMMAARASTSWLCSSFITLDDGQTLTHGDETLTHATRRSRTATETERAPDGRLSEWESIPGVHLHSLRTRAYRRSFGFGLRGDQRPEGFSFVGYFPAFRPLEALPRHPAGGVRAAAGLGQSPTSRKTKGKIEVPE